MSHNHKNTLKSLFPIELGGVFDADLELEGQQLDTAQVRAEDLLTEMFADTTGELIVSWERVYGITDSENKPMQARRDAIIEKIRARGGQSRQFFIDLAATRGITISIKELSPPKAGIAKAGVAKVWPDEIRFVWQVTVSQQGLYYAKAGIAKAGEKILWKDTSNPIESILTRLKPAHTQVTFFYS